MPASEARIQANRTNAQKLTGPRTDEGKARLRGNALKHGMTGEGVVVPAEDAAEIDRLQGSYEAELKPTSDLGRTLVRRMALMTVRMDRCVANETATLTVRVRQAEEDFDADWPAVEGQDDPDRDRMRLRAARLAMFDPSREATLARKYEAAAERSFFRSLKELRRVEKDARATVPAPVAAPARSSLGSISPREASATIDEALAAGPPRNASTIVPARPSKPAPMIPSLPRTPLLGHFDVPITIGRTV